MNKTCIVRTIDNLVTVSIAGKGQFTVPNCSDELFDKIGAIEAAIMKERLRSQIQMKKYITAEQYMKAKEIAIKRLSK